MAHFTLTEEVMRLGGGKLNLEQALDATRSWAAGRYTEDPEPQVQNGTSQPVQRDDQPRRKTEREMVAQNEAAMAALGARLQSVAGLGNFMRN